MDVLKVSGATVAYNRVKAVSDVSFTVREGDYFCIVGANGSGKSSLIKALLGLAPLFSGSVEFFLKPDEIAYLPQMNSITPGMPATVLEVVKTGLQKPGRRPFYSQEDVAAARGALERLGIPDYASRRVSELSGGQQQRMLLARALCRNPRFLVLDEPCAGLDENITDSLYDLLYELNSGGVTLLMVSHDLAQVAKYATHVVALDHSMKFSGDAETWLRFRKEGRL